MAVDHGPSHKKGQPGIAQAALSGLCPHCSARTLFEAPARIAIECSACGLKLAEFERGGRLAGIVTIVVAAILIAIAMTIETLYRPPLWLPAGFWAPVTVGAVIGVLRLYKTALLYAKYEAHLDAQSEGFGE